ncbi:hypothetical protein HZF24_10900 [Sedimentibacter hydroxybenzoicus DSM 7310]|uniref:Uncharacterized protein n=1 Tax=Sedimentibacter hydroxybenzoicus DSM 7310 TaxID=1123245 RepID=A0A974BK32_SEDHY|nr:hypothetical protein [Sedimentibacter hydroxybenzoicus]NYB74643.1 hypothetical protein [Sedimentibacter hydroxybenzoicus DSM 7310]
MERKNILEKLGLIEKVENESQVNNSNEDIAEEQIAKTEIEKPQFTEVIKNKIQDDVKKAETEAETIVIGGDDSDPISVVKRKKLLKIDEIYRNFDILTEGINSLAIVESFQKALPDYLPTDVKRQSILNIIASSNVKVESLLRDGNDKLRCLNDFSEAFTKESNEVVSDFEKEIKRLNEKINNYKTAIDNMKKLHTEQDFTVKYEIEKINNILQFIEPEK